MHLQRTSVKGDDFRIKGNRRMTYIVSSCVFLGKCVGEVVDGIVLAVHWDEENPEESVVELRYKLESDEVNTSHPIDPTFLRGLLSDGNYARYRDAVVDLAPGRAFIKGLCGPWAANLETPSERAADTLAGGLLQDHIVELAVALMFPDKVKTLGEANRVYELLNIVQDFICESGGYGIKTAERKEIQKTIDKIKGDIKDADEWLRGDHQTFAECSEKLAKYGIIYDLDD